MTEVGNTSVALAAAALSFIQAGLVVDELWRTLTPDDQESHRQGDTQVAHTAELAGQIKGRHAGDHGANLPGRFGRRNVQRFPPVQFGRDHVGDRHVIHSDARRFQARPGMLAHNPAATGGGGKVIPSPEVEAEAGAYRWPDGQLFVPSTAVYAAMANAAKALKYKSIPASKYGSRKLLAAGVRMLADGFGLADDAGDPITTYEIDVRRVVVQRASVLRARPIIPSWQTTVQFAYDPDVIGHAIVSVVRDALQVAGQSFGLLDFRPEKGGPYGRFIVRSFEYRN